MPFVSFPHIGDIDSALRRLRFAAAYTGRDVTGEPVYDHSRPKPTVVFKGKVKVHGTFAAIRFDPDGTYAVQSRSTDEVVDGHMGFAAFVKELDASGVLHKIKVQAKKVGLVAESPELQHEPITVAGEWFGAGVVRGNTAVSRLKEKHWGIFMVVVGNVIDEQHDERFFFHDLTKFERPQHSRVHVMDDFGMFTVTANLNDDLSVAQARERMIALTNAVDENCPVGAKLVPDADSKTGEGIVWTTQFQDHDTWCKTKGSKHSATKVRVIDPEEAAKRTAVAALGVSLASEGRVQQAMDILNASGITNLTRLDTAAISRWVVTDALREGAEEIKAGGFTVKEATASIGRRAAIVFHAILEEEAEQKAKTAEG